MNNDQMETKNGHFENVNIQIKDSHKDNSQNKDNRFEINESEKGNPAKKQMIKSTINKPSDRDSEHGNEHNKSKQNKSGIIKQKRNRIKQNSHKTNNNKDHNNKNKNKKNNKNNSFKKSKRRKEARKTNLQADENTPNNEEDYKYQIEKLKKEACSIESKIQKISVSANRASILKGSLKRDVYKILNQFRQLLMKTLPNDIYVNLIEFQWKYLVYPIATKYRKSIAQIGKEIEQCEGDLEMMISEFSKTQSNVTSSNFLHPSVTKWKDNVEIQKKNRENVAKEHQRFCKFLISLYHNICIKWERKKSLDQSVKVRTELYLYMGDLARFLGMVTSERKSFKGAIRSYTKAAYLNPRSGFAYNQIGLVYIKFQYKLMALSHFARACISSDPYKHAKKNFSYCLEKVDDKTFEPFYKWLSLIYNQNSKSIDEEHLKITTESCLKCLRKNCQDAILHARHFFHILLYLIELNSSDIFQPFILQIFFQVGILLCMNGSSPLLCAFVAFLTRGSIQPWLYKHINTIHGEYGKFLTDLFDLDNRFLSEHIIPTKMNLYVGDIPFLGISQLDHIYHHPKCALPKQTSDMWNHRLLFLTKLWCDCNDHIQLFGITFQIVPDYKKILLQNVESYAALLAHFAKLHSQLEANGHIDVAPTELSQDEDSEIDGESGIGSEIDDNNEVDESSEDSHIQMDSNIKSSSTIKDNMKNNTSLENDGSDEAEMNMFIPPDDESEVFSIDVSHLTNDPFTSGSLFQNTYYSPTHQPANNIVPTSSTQQNSLSPDEHVIENHDNHYILPFEMGTPEEGFHDVASSKSSQSTEETSPIPPQNQANESTLFNKVFYKI